MIAKYTRNPNCIICQVNKSEDEINCSEVVDIVKQYGDFKKRTIKVITRADTMKKDYIEQFETFEGLHIVAVRNRTQDELNIGTTIDEVRLRE